MTKFQSPVRKFEVDLDGEGKEFTTFRMALNYQALAILCDLWGIELNDLDARINSLDAKSIPEVIYAALAALDETRTKADAKAFCDALTISDLVKVVQELIGASAPALTAEGTGKGPQAPPKSTK